MKDKINVGLVGASFMGKAHSHAYRNVNFFFDGIPTAVQKVLCDINEDLVKENAKKYYWENYMTSYQDMVKRPDIDLVDVCVPGNLHKDVVLAAIAEGKNVLCEKPLANSLSEAREMLDAANKAGVKHMTGFVYRRIPAIQFAKQLIDAGRLGKINQIRCTYLQDWIIDPQYPLVWRLRKDIAGSGSLGDLGAHIVDLARFLSGDEIENVVGMDKTFIKRRPLPLAGGGSGLGATKASKEMGDVTVDDAALFMCNFKSGAIGSFEATRFAGGHKNGEYIEIDGSLGTIRFHFEAMNELEFCDLKDDPREQGFKKILVMEPTHPYMSAWWPSGHIIGYEHLFIHEVRDLFDNINNDTTPIPSFVDGVKCQEVLDAVSKSIVEKRWVNISEM